MKGNTPTLICIPDISGFTKFMSDTDIEMSSKVIPSLLNKVIYANDIGLKVSEIEGDAILFYRSGELPSLEKIVHQCKKFYNEFYSQLNALQEKYKNDDLSINIPNTLGLKIIMHYGDQVSAVPIGKNIKLMGEDVIIAHRLLKNKVPYEEYILISDDLLQMYSQNEISDYFDWENLHENDAQYKHIGDVKYSYIDLKPLNP